VVLNIPKRFHVSPAHQRYESLTEKYWTCPSRDQFETEEEAIALANDTKYGLGAFVFTTDKALMSRVASQIQSGMVSQNNLSYIKPYDPFGGYKQSGIGREHGKYGFEDVTQIKVIAQENNMTKPKIIIIPGNSYSHIEIISSSH
jgi:hypothetical protein